MTRVNRKTTYNIQMSLTTDSDVVDFKRRYEFLSEQFSVQLDAAFLL